MRSKGTVTLLPYEGINYVRCARFVQDGFKADLMMLPVLSLQTPDSAKAAVEKQEFPPKRFVVYSRTPCKKS